MSPLVVGKAIFIPRVNYWPKHGWRAEIVIDDGAMGDIMISEFVDTREEARRLGGKALLKAAERYMESAGTVGLR